MDYELELPTNVSMLCIALNEWIFTLGTKMEMLFSKNAMGWKNKEKSFISYSNWVRNVGTSLIFMPR